MSRPLRIVGGFAVHRFGVFVQYPVHTLLWMLSAFTPIVVMFAWSAALAGADARYERAVFAYFAVVFLVRQVTAAWVSDDLNRHVNEGQMASRLLRPIPVFWEHAGGQLAGIAMKGLPAVVGTVVIVALSGTREFVRIEALLPFAVALVLGTSILFCVGWLIGSVAFWVKDTKPILSLATLLGIFLGGSSIPLAFMPGPLLALALATPFPSIVAGPVGMLVPALAIEPPAHSLLRAVLWLALTATLAAAAWRRGVRRYDAS